MVRHEESVVNNTQMNFFEEQVRKLKEKVNMPIQE